MTETDYRCDLARPGQGRRFAATKTPSPGIEVTRIDWRYLEPQAGLEAANRA